MCKLRCQLSYMLINHQVHTMCRWILWKQLPVLNVQRWMPHVFKQRNLHWLQAVRLLFQLNNRHMPTMFLIKLPVMPQQRHLHTMLNWQRLLPRQNTTNLPHNKLNKATSDKKLPKPHIHPKRLGLCMRTVQRWLLCSEWIQQCLITGMQLWL